MNMMDARSLACYIKRYYDEHSEKKEECSDILIQKCLYFLFAYWGAYITKGKKENNFEVSNQNEYLFSNRIEAWNYGPVIPEVYFTNKKGELIEYNISDEELFNENSLLKTTINGLLDDLIKISPFKLVTLSHQDECWSRNYKIKIEEGKRSQEIKKEEIIEEYECKI